MGADDTIVAPATAPGRGAVAILRVSGRDASEVCLALTRMPPGRPRVAELRWFSDPQTRERIDLGLVIWFAGPSSYTGEDMLELHCHGGPAVLAALLQAATGLPGVRLAEPGEFTRRAFLANRLDLSQAEAVADLIVAGTRNQARQALRQLDGELGRRCEKWRESIVSVLALAEAEIDFGAEHDVPDQLIAALPHVASIRTEIAESLVGAERGERLREGVTVAIIGRPNAGKSSLINLLAARDVALVTEIAGTTRDVLEVSMDLGGVPVLLLDTAGLRESDDPVERLGVARAIQRADAADLRVLVVDATDPAILDHAGDTLLVLNKGDAASPPPDWSGPVISCRTGAGISDLLSKLADRAIALTGDGSALVTRHRHRVALQQAAAALSRFSAVADGMELAIAAEELRTAARAIGSITGRVSAEDILDRIFSNFCIGK